MFRGHFVHALDDKGRVSLPARFRDQLASDGDARVVLAPAPFDECLHLYPLRTWEDYERKISELPKHDPDIARFRRRYVSKALDCEIDKAGRLRISPELREYAHLKTEVLFAGMGGNLELWATDAFDRENDMSQDALVKFQEKIKELGI